MIEYMCRNLLVKIPVWSDERLLIWYPVENYRHFAYWPVRLLDLLDISPTTCTVHPQIAHFAYKIARI